MCMCVCVCVVGTEVVMVKEWYQHRKDHLEQREVNKVDNVTTERFKDGRSFKLLCKSAFWCCPAKTSPLCTAPVLA